jgi:hypothetical protein
VAVHEQSGVVDTVTLPLAPPAGSELVGLEAVSWHFAGEGPAVSDADEQAAAANGINRHATRRRGSTTPAP